MIGDLTEAVRQAAAAAGAENFEVVAEVPATPDRGDVAFPAAFGLAKKLRRPPRKIAETLAEALRSGPHADGIERVEVAGPGYVNVFLRRGAHLAALAEGVVPDPGAPAGTHIVEHTSINPNKAAHIGHLRNAALGDSFARILRFLGRRVEVQNYIDDTGVQVADVALGFARLRDADEGEVRRLAAAPRFDFLCWDLYTEVSRWIGSDPAGEAARREALHGLEHGEAPWAGIGAVVSEAVARRHLETMARIGVRYDLLACEKTVLRLRFWDRAFALLREAGALRRSESGKNRGCWVMDTPLAQDGEKVIVRSNGTATYVAKDIGYQVWQLGELDREARFRRFFEYPDGSAAWITTHESGADDAPPFGGAALVHHVIDARQSYPQRIVQEAVARLASERDRARTRHFSYEMVSLTAKTVAALGLPVSPGAEASGGEDDSGGAVEVSGRKGVGVKADDFLDALIARAGEEVAARNPALDEETRGRLAEDIAVGALRYLMVRVTKNQIIVFDLEEALSFDGATGPYLQYAAVRARKILDRADLPAPTAFPPPPEGLDERLAALDPAEAADLWVLLREAGRLGETAVRAAGEEDPQILARWAYEGAQRFNGFYHRYRIAGEADANARELRAYAVQVFDWQHRLGLDLLGIPVPEQM